MECISGGAKQILDTLIEIHMKEASPTQAKTLTKLREQIAEMPICKIGGRARKPRKLSKWQLCIKEKRSDKWDPTLLKKLSPEYKAGTCPSKEFLEKHKLGKV